MFDSIWFNSIISWSGQYAASLVWTFIMLLVYVAITKFTLPKIEKKIDQSNLKSEEALRA